MRRVNAVALVAVLLVGLVNCEIWYIAPDGEDNPAGGGQSDPFRTLSYALGFAGKGDIIYASAGVYSGSANVGLSLSDVTVQGEGPDRTTFQGDSSVAYNFATDGNVHISDLSITDGVTGIKQNTLDLILSYVDFTGSMNTAVYWSGAATATNATEVFIGPTVNYGFTFNDYSASLTEIHFQYCTFENPFAFLVNITYGGAEDWKALTLDDCKFQGSTFVLSTIDNPESFSVHNCTFENADETALVADGPFEMVLADCTFTSNQAGLDGYTKGNGGALYRSYRYYDQSFVPSLTMIHTRFESNTAAKNGGAVVIDGSALVMTDCTFDKNVASDGGAVYTKNTQYTQLNSSFVYCVFSNNIVTNNGGALVYDRVQYATVTDCDFEVNSAEVGGAIYATTVDESIVIENCDFVENFAGSKGGTFALNNLNVATLSSVSVTSSAALGGHGGGIFVEGVTEFNAWNSTVQDCSATQFGGGLYMSGTTASLNLTNIAGNTAYNGGGVYSVRGANLAGKVNLTSVTITDNSASSTGGGYFCDSGWLGALDLTLSGNTAGQGSGAACSFDCTSQLVDVQVEDSEDIAGCAVTVNSTISLAPGKHFNGRTTQDSYAALVFDKAMTAAEDRLARLP